VDDDQLTLGQFIWLVRRELQWVQEVDRDQPLRFEVESMELDLVRDATRTKEGGGGGPAVLPTLVGVLGRCCLWWNDRRYPRAILTPGRISTRTSSWNATESSSGRPAPSIRPLKS
jgi:Trypsin-co-occurring domain 2